MPIHDIALKCMDALVARAAENQRAHGHWWEEEAVVMTPPTEQEIASKLASVTRRLHKAQQALEALFNDDELAAYQKAEGEPKWEKGSSHDEFLKNRWQDLDCFYAIVVADEQKLRAYRQYGKLKELQSQLSNGTSNIVYDEDESSDDPLGNKAKHCFQLAVDYPNEVETSQVASALSGLLRKAFSRAGYGYEEYGLTTPSAYFDKGKLVIEIDDKEEKFRFDTQALDAFDWQKIRRELVDLKQEVEFAGGWRRKQTPRGEVLEKVADPEDVHISMLNSFLMSDWDDTSHWDTWLPPVRGTLGRKNAPEPLEIKPCDAAGTRIEYDELPDFPHVGNMTPDGEEAPISSHLDISSAYKKAIITVDAAKHYLQDFLGIKGLDLRPPSAHDAGYRPR